MYINPSPATSSHFLHFPSFSKHVVNQLQSTTSFLKLIFPSFFLINFYHDRIISFLFYTSFNYVVIYNGDLRCIIWSLLQLLFLFKTIICFYSNLPTYNPSLVKHVFYQSLDVSSFSHKAYWLSLLNEKLFYKPSLMNQTFLPIFGLIFTIKSTG